MLEISTCSWKDNELSTQTENKQENTPQLKSKISRLSDILSEKQRIRTFEDNLNKNRKKIRMLNKGTMDLDPLLAMRQYAQKKFQSWIQAVDGIKQFSLISFVLNQFLILNQGKSHQTCSSQKVLVEQKNWKIKQGCYLCGNMDTHRDIVMLWKAK